MIRLSAAVVLALSQSGCVSATDSSATFSTVRSTPMGPSQYMVSCVDSPRYCAQESNKLCPSGFDVVNNVVNPADYGRMTMVVKCHQAAVESVANPSLVAE